MTYIYHSLSHYRAMWVIVMFDLSTFTKTDRYRYRKFREFLLDSGYAQMQYSIYLRNAPSKEVAERYIRRLKTNIPSTGVVNIISITDKQYENILSFRGEIEEKMPERGQLSLF